MLKNWDIFVKKYCKNNTVMSKYQKIGNLFKNLMTQKQNHSFKVEYTI